MTTRKEIERKLDQFEFTAFQRRVLLACYGIKEGETLSYKDLAKRAGSPKAYRAVGTVMKNNPFPVTIPCHRVIKSSGKIGNYSGAGCVKREAELLFKGGAMGEGATDRRRNVWTIVTLI